MQIIIPNLFQYFPGTPLPKLEWTKDGERLLEVDGVEWSQFPERVSFRLTQAWRRHAGEYSLQLTNDGGQEVVPITIKVIGECSTSSVLQKIIVFIKHV